MDRAATSDVADGRGGGRQRRTLGSGVAEALMATGLRWGRER